MGEEGALLDRWLGARRGWGREKKEDRRRMIVLMERYKSHVRKGVGGSRWISDLPTRAQCWRGLVPLPFPGSA